MYSKKTNLTTEKFESSTYARKVSVTLECPYCGHIQKTTFDKEIGENKKDLAITWKCPKCGEYSRIKDWKLHKLDNGSDDEE